MNTQNVFDLIIVGCGVAGIGAAIKFQELRPDARFLILEARDRVGGRAFTDVTTFGSNAPVDLGAHWLCHHQPNNVLRNYYTMTEKDKMDTDIYGVWQMGIFDEDGTPISEDLIEQVQTIVGQLLSKIKQYPYEQEDVSMIDAIHDEYEKLESEKMRRLVNLWLGFIENHEASSLSQLSAKCYTKGDGGQENSYLAINDGLGSFIEYLAEKHRDRIELNAVVTDVNISNQFNGLVHVSTKDGRSYLSKYILFTIPLGCLKNASITFTPPLPSWKQKAIQNMGFGLHNKIYLQFRSIFWDEKLTKISVATSRFRYYFCIPEVRILVLVVAGNIARELEKQRDEQIIEEIINSLRRIYPQITNPVKWLITRWGSDPFSLGSYSTFQVGSTVELLEDLARETHDGHIHWAGEHTNYNGSIGYVDSGFESGQREAVLIHKQLLNDQELKTEKFHP